MFNQTWLGTAAQKKRAEAVQEEEFSVQRRSEEEPGCKEFTAFTPSAVGSSVVGAPLISADVTTRRRDPNFKPRGSSLSIGRRSNSLQCIVTPSLRQRQQRHTATVAGLKSA
jgi:hypothetical protein